MMNVVPAAIRDAEDLPSPKGSPSRAYIGFDRVTVTYGRGESATRALDETTLVRSTSGEFSIRLVGPSGLRQRPPLLKLVAELPAGPDERQRARSPAARWGAYAGAHRQWPTRTRRCLPWLSVPPTTS